MNEVAEIVDDKAVEKLAIDLLNVPQVDCPVTHKFCQGIYYREIFMPASSFVIGKKHKTQHFNIILCGRAKVLMDNQVHYIQGPDSFISEPNVRKVLRVFEDMRWVTIHPTDLTNVEKLEELLVEEPEGFKKQELEVLCHLQ